MNAEEIEEHLENCVFKPCNKIHFDGTLEMFGEQWKLIERENDRAVFWNEELNAALHGRIRECEYLRGIVNNAEEFLADWIEF